MPENEYVRVRVVSSGGAGYNQSESVDLVELIYSTFGAGGSGNVFTSQGTGLPPIWTANGGGAGTSGSPVATHFLGVFSSLVVASQVGLPRILVAAGTFLGWRVAGLTGPVGADAIFDIKKSSNGGSTWTSLWASSPGNRPKIAAGATTGNGTAFDTASYAAGDLLLPDIVQIGSTTAGKNVTLALY